MPNQEKVAKCYVRVTYHDKSESMRLILLPNWETMQAYSGLMAGKSFYLHEEARMGMA